MGFVVKIRWELGFGQNLGAEMGFGPPSDPLEGTLSLFGTTLRVTVAPAMFTVYCTVVQLTQLTKK